jgi:hypothetical protein
MTSKKGNILYFYSQKPVLGRSRLNVKSRADNSKSRADNSKSRADNSKSRLIME